MKTISTSILSQRNLWAVLMFGLFLITFDSCRKRDELSEEEAAEMSEQTISAKSGGMTDQIESATKFAEAAISFCSQSFDTVVTRSSLPGASVTYNFTHTWSYDLDCLAGQPAQFNFDVTGTSVYDAPRMSSSDDMTLHFVVTGLANSASAYIFNGTYVRNGTQQSKIRNKNSFESVITFTVNNVQVNKSTQKITGGTASLDIEASTSGGNDASFSGTVTFLGNSQATLLINGNSYTLQW